MSKPFNVTIIQPPGYIHSQALSEAAEYVQAMLQRCGVAAELSLNRLPASHHNVVFCAHLLLPQHVAGLPADSIIFNSEQLDNRDGWYFKRGVYGELLQRFHVWDYSANNLPLIAHVNKAVLPFRHCDALIRNTPPLAEKPGLLFYGQPTDRRIKLIQEIEAAGIAVTPVAELYGADRDAAMLSAWAVLNLHNADHVRNFEVIRCFHPLINNIPVISEDETDDPSAEAFRSFIFSFRTLSLVEGIQALYTDAAGFSSQAQAKLKAFRASDALPDFQRALAAYMANTQEPPSAR